MSALDRVTDAINGDGPITPQEQAELVTDMLARKPLFECPNCQHAYREPFCDGCGRNLSLRAREARHA